MPQAPNAKRVIIICGATATGKTALAINAARHFQTEIISCDSRQCYREMTIGVAKPSPGELQEVPHHFINSHSIHEEVNAAIFQDYALNKCNELFVHHDTVVMVGGTGLYIKAFAEGIDEIPPIDPSFRKQIVEEYQSRGLSWLQQAVRSEDPLYFSTGEIQNPQRLMRALEVIRGTGKSIRSYQRGQSIQRDFEITKIAIDVPREELNQRINHRVDVMMESGLFEEAKGLYPYRHLPALKTVGYAELFDHFEGKLSLTEAIDRIKINTRQYAKRQLTWFKKDKEVMWGKGEW
ncbi:MAG TPA: tRNA (adenosine(37)-N6)-dimethylallyltransferase MiaA [Flavitalea sp.]|nr:tRNA (adenosine(37)-N6)-dimethylallyltransferase MiaA [Flavitalea sp.]